MQLILIQFVFVTLTYGLEFEPRPEDSKSSLIYYRSSNDETSFHFKNRLDSFLSPYTRPRPDASHIIKCQYGVPPEKGSNKVCNVDVTSWSPCVSSLRYGYDSYNGGPCIFLKLSKIPNWTPEYYNSATVPENMPSYLKERIRETEQIYRDDSNYLKTVWISCEGENAIDKENIGFIQYYPNMGFGGQYFPISNENQYLSPLVAVYFEHPERGIVISVQCKAWARNLEHDSTVRFEILIDF